MISTDHRYEMKGSRVARLSVDDIRSSAKRFGEILRINRHTPSNMEDFVERLSSENICIDPIDDEEWFFVTDAICVPEHFTIRMPESTFIKLCIGERNAIGLLFHELGHLMLAHKAVLHNERSAPPAPDEDSEVQADTFATFVLSRMGLGEVGQLCFDF